MNRAGMGDLPENAFGQRKRLEYVSRQLAQTGAQHVLDVGCGTGELLAMPLAARFPNVSFVAVDEDRTSIEHARKTCTLPNLKFLLSEELDAAERFDFVIASEVIEHVEDPHGFLLWLKSVLQPNGVILLTLPNGFGPYELIVLLNQFLNRALRRTKRKPASAQGITDTLASSPHINFFSYGTILRIIRSAGLSVAHYRSRTFLCGWFFDGIVATRLQWNADVADRLPAVLVSDWMFLLKADPQGIVGKPSWHRGGFARLRRRWNEEALA